MGTAFAAACAAAAFLLAQRSSVADGWPSEQRERMLSGLPAAARSPDPAMLTWREAAGSFLSGGGGG